MTGPQNDRLTLACFPYAGADGSLYASWQSSLGDGIEVLPLGAPLTSPTAERESVLDRARSLLDELRVRCCASRVVFFGHSLGALTAFEATRWLVRHGEPLPEQLILSALPTPEPGLRWSHTNLNDGRSVRDLITKTEALPPEVVADDEFLDEILADAKQDFELLGAYRYTGGPLLPMPVVVLGGREDRLVNPEALSRWKVHCAGSFCLQLFEGGHMFIDTAAREVKDFLRIRLRREAVDG